MFKNAITVDVEDYFHVAALSGAISRDQWDFIPSRVGRNTSRLLDLFDERGVLGTFFVLGWVAERHPEIVREIRNRGHELACHGYSHEMVYRQAPKEFRAETLRAKSILEDAAGVAVTGYRAASYSITSKSLWALDILAEAGFNYDSSVFPVRHDLYGVPDAPRFPYRLKTPAGNTLLEFPPSTYRVAGINVPAAGGGYFRLFPYALTRHMLRSLNRGHGQPAIFYLHPWEVDPDQPKVDVSLRSRFRHYNNLDKCEKRLRRLLRDFEFTTVREVLADLGPATTTTLAVA